MCNFDLIITRHKNMKRALINIGLVDISTPIISKATDASKIKGKKVIGFLPKSLSSLCSEYTEIVIEFPYRKRSNDTSAEDLVDFITSINTYKVSRLCSYNHLLQEKQKDYA